MKDGVESHRTFHSDETSNWRLDRYRGVEEVGLSASKAIMTVGCPFTCPIPSLRFIGAIQNSIELQASAGHLEANAQRSTQETEKARNYIERLHSARAGDRWHEVPALVRKIEKHAPHRSCELGCDARKDFREWL